MLFEFLHSAAGQKGYHFGAFAYSELLPCVAFVLLLRRRRCRQRMADKLRFDLRRGSKGRNLLCAVNAILPNATMPILRNTKTIARAEPQNFCRDINNRIFITAAALPRSNRGTVSLQALPMVVFYRPSPRWHCESFICRFSVCRIFSPVVLSHRR